MPSVKNEEMDSVIADHMGRALTSVGDAECGWMIFCPEFDRRVWKGRGPRVDEMRKFWAQNMLDMLMKEAWLNGRWFVCWVDWNWRLGAYSRAVLGYQDFDFDTPFVIDIEDDFVTMAGAMDDYIDQAMEAYSIYKQEIKIRGITPEEMIKAARGQKSKDPKADPGLDVLGLRW
jgi:hypothetical protein